MFQMVKCFLLTGFVVLSGCEPAAKDGESASNDGGQVESSAVSQTSHAVCELKPIGDSGVSGTVHFTKQGKMVQIRGTVTGLAPGKHGFHVHEHGDLSDQATGKSAGGHFNPTDQPHGRPSDSERHVGDLGNIEANEDGTAKIQMEDDVIQLNGPNAIVGRALVIHAQEDQFTQPTGDAGDRVAFGVIEAVNE